MASRDFSRKRETIEFTIDSDTFQAAPAIAADTLAEGVGLLNGFDVASTTPAEQMQVMRDFLAMCLMPESFERFSYRMGDKVNPIELSQVDEVSTWLVEQYGMRPTDPSLPSADGSADPESGTPSTDSVQVVVLSSEDYAPTGS